MQTTTQIFGQYDLQVNEPLIGNLPVFQQSQWRGALDQSTLVEELSQAQDLADVEFAIRRYVERAERAVLSVGRGFYLVTVGKGKTNLSRHIAISCARGRAPGAPTVTARLDVPASLVVLAPAGARGHQEAFLSAFFVDQQLTQIARRAAYPRQQFERVLLTQPCWPAHLKQQFLDSLLSQLPSAAAIERDKLARARARAMLAAQYAAAARVVEQQRETLRALLHEQKRKADLERERRRAKMPVYKNVNVKWTIRTAMRGRFEFQEHHAENVSVRVAGAVSYVIYPDGREVRVATKNLEYV
jgi:hypothetical protein